MRAYVYKCWRGSCLGAISKSTIHADTCTHMCIHATLIHIKALHMHMHMQSSLVPRCRARGGLLQAKYGCCTPCMYQDTFCRVACTEYIMLVNVHGRVNACKHAQWQRMHACVHAHAARWRRTATEYAALRTITHGCFCMAAVPACLVACIAKQLRTAIAMQITSMHGW